MPTEQLFRTYRLIEGGCRDNWQRPLDLRLRQQVCWRLTWQRVVGPGRDHVATRIASYLVPQTRCQHLIVRRVRQAGLGQRSQLDCAVFTVGSHDILARSSLGICCASRCSRLWICGRQVGEKFSARPLGAWQFE